MSEVPTALLVATNRSLVTACLTGGEWHVAGRALEGQDVTSVIAREGVILAGTREGIFRSMDGGASWENASSGLHLPHVRWLSYHPQISDRELAGTEPAGVFLSGDGGDSWIACAEVEALRDKHRWFLPYSPEAGCVRGFAIHGERAYAAVEVGGVLRSDDGGYTWRLAAGSSGEPTFDVPPAPFVFADVHSIETHPASPNLVYAATAEGLYRSADGGDTWTVSHAGSYCRALWVDPADPGHIILGPADSVRYKNGRIEETRDGGTTWSPASEGLDLPWPDRMVERFAALGEWLLATTSDGRLYAAPTASLHWSRMLPEVSGINAVTALGEA